MFPSKRANHAIFIEGLPIECVETDLIKLLQTCGKVNAISLHRQPSPMIPALRPNSVSASVEFQSRENAEAAVYLLETSVIWGRRLSARVITPNAPLVNNSLSMTNMGAANNNNSNLNNHVALAASKALRSAQVHISYLTKQLVTIVTEQMIFDLFSTFGKVIEVSLKKKCVDTEMCIQNGYGFVHYPLTAEGIESALRAVETLHQVTINNISYDCSVSNQLKQVLFSTGHLPASNNVSNNNSAPMTNPNTMGNKTQAWMDASAQDAMNSNSRFPSLFNNNQGNSNHNLNNTMQNNHMNNNNSRSLFPSLSNGNLTANHNNYPSSNNMSVNNNMHLFSNSNNNYNNSDAGSLTGRLSLQSGATSYQGGLSSLDGTNSIGFSSLNSFSSQSNHNNLNLKNSSFGDDLFTHTNQFPLGNNNANALNGFSPKPNSMYGGASIGSGRSSHEDHSSAYHRSQYKGNSTANSLYNNVPLIAEDDFLFTDTNVSNNGAQSGNNNAGYGSAKLPGVFNKWF